MTDEEATQEVRKIIAYFGTRCVSRAGILDEFKRRFPDTRYTVWADGEVNIGTSAKKYVSKACRALEHEGVIKRHEGWIEVTLDKPSSAC
jgi:hypothetical protein